MRTQRTMTGVAFGCLLALCFRMGYSDEAAEKGRAILEANKDAVITVRVVMSMSFGGQEREQESEATGTVIDPSGLTVLSLIATDPSAMYESFREEGGGQVVSKITDLKMILSDGTELAAEVVLRDKDLDLAFIRPVASSASPMSCVDLEHAGAPQLLDELAVLGQLGRVARRTHTVFLERVEAIVDRPRTFYVPGQYRAQDVWCSPAFTLDGQFVGIGVMRMLTSRAARGRGDNLIIIVPAADVREATRQVPAVGERPSLPETSPAPPAQEPTEPEPAVQGSG